MTTSRELSPGRLAVGQLLGRLLREFCTELFAPAAEHGYGDLREPHLNVCNVSATVHFRRGREPVV